MWFYQEVPRVHSLVLPLAHSLSLSPGNLLMSCKGRQQTCSLSLSLSVFLVCCLCHMAYTLHVVQLSAFVPAAHANGVDAHVREWERLISWRCHKKKRKTYIPCINNNYLFSLFPYLSLSLFVDAQRVEAAHRGLLPDFMVTQPWHWHLRGKV